MTTLILKCRKRDVYKRQVFGQMDEQPGTRLRVPLTALTMAEYFRDVQNQDAVSYTHLDVYKRQR